MFGLGPTELLLVAVVIVLVAGPKALGKVFKTAKKAQELRSKLSPQGMLQELMSEPKKKEGPKRAKKKRKPAEPEDEEA